METSAVSTFQKVSVEYKTIKYLYEWPREVNRKYAH